MYSQEENRLYGLECGRMGYCADMNTIQMCYNKPSNAIMSGYTGKYVSDMGESVCVKAWWDVTSGNSRYSPDSQP